MKSDDSGSRVLHEESASEIGDRVSESDGEEPAGETVEAIALMKVEMRM